MYANRMLSLLFMAGFAFIISTTVAAQSAGKPWDVPDKYKSMKNPVKADKESISIGKSLYAKHCKSCHGGKGLGDGSKAAQLKTKCGDFTSKDFKAQSDGALFFKTSEGRDDMPSFKKKIPEKEDIWHIVNYIRSL